MLRVSTAAGSATTDVAATGAVQPLNVVPGRTGWLRITIAGARRVILGYPGAGISDVLIPGVRVTRLLQPAEDPAGQQAPAAVFSFPQPVPSPFAFADPAAAAPMARTFTVAQPGDPAAAGGRAGPARPRPGRAAGLADPPARPGRAAGQRGLDAGRAAGRVPGQPDQRVGGHAVDRRYRQPGHPPPLGRPAPHLVADRPAGPRPAVHAADRQGHQSGRHPPGAASGPVAW